MMIIHNIENVSWLMMLMCPFYFEAETLAVDLPIKVRKNENDLTHIANNCKL